MSISDTKSQRLRRTHVNDAEMRMLARKMSNATKDKYMYGTAIDLTKYTADGTIFDYMAGVKNVSTLCIQMKLLGHIQHD